MKHIIVIALIVSSGLVAYGQSAIVEVKHSAPAAAAPRECLVAFRGFFQYLQKTEPGIVRDEQAQKRWLTQELRKALAQKLGRFTSPADDPDFPRRVCAGRELESVFPGKVATKGTKGTK